MTLTIDDTGSQTKLKISKGSKDILKRKGKSIKSLLKFVYENTKNDKLKSSILELQKVYKFMVGSTTTLELKG